MGPRSWRIALARFSNLRMLRWPFLRYATDRSCATTGRGATISNYLSRCIEGQRAAVVITRELQWQLSNLTTSFSYATAQPASAYPVSFPQLRCGLGESH